MSETLESPKRRGRPAKAKPITTAEPRKRGRPKKPKPLGMEENIKVLKKRGRKPLPPEQRKLNNRHLICEKCGHDNLYKFGDGLHTRKVVPKDMAKYLKYKEYRERYLAKKKAKLENQQLIGETINDIETHS